MSNNTNSNSTIDEEIIGKPYMGPTKVVWKDGQKIAVPDLESLSSPFSPNAVVHNDQQDNNNTNNNNKPAESYLISSDKDEVHNFQFLGEAGDNNNYEIWRCSKYHTMGEIKNKEYHDNILWKGEFNDIKHNNKPYSGKFHCNYCSKSFFTDKERITHSYSHMTRAS
jgi:hypothetical protein